jgi:DNA-binding response OmpR family regulator
VEGNEPHRWRVVPFYDSTMPRILVVDDEPKIRKIVTSYLEQEGFDVSEAGNGPSAVDMAERFDPDVVILDVRLPGFDGIEALRQIRTKSDVYVIMLTARSEETDKLIGLSVGADDYMTKPFSARELVARVKAVLRRSRQGNGPESDRITVGPLVLDNTTRIVTVDETPVDLTALEFDLLGALASAPGRVYSRGQLIEKVWGWDFFGDERIVDVHVRKIRQKIGDDPAEPRFIATVRGVGYRFVDPS